MSRFEEGARIAILYGAGASKGCGGIVPHPPPLGSELYDYLREHSSAWNDPVVDDYMGDSKSFEASYAKLRSAEPILHSRLIPELCRCLSTFRVDGYSLYEAVFNLVVGYGRAAHTLFCTLNYDCILESALRRNPLTKCFYMGQPIPFPLGAPSILKLHGSISWLVPNVYHFTTDNIEQARLRIAPIDSARVEEEYRDGGRLAGIRLYEPGKSAFLGMLSSQFRALDESWAAWTECCDGVLVIGCNTNVDDDHVWAPIVRSSGKVLYVGNDGETLERRVGNRRFFHAGKTFADGLVHISSWLQT